MDISNEVIATIGTPESEELEYKAVLPPSRSLAQMIAAFANAHGGLIVLGVATPPSGILINGLSEDFHANTITQKAIDLITPKPIVKHQYVIYKNSSVYALKIDKSLTPVTIEGKLYLRKNDTIVLVNSSKINAGGYTRIHLLYDNLETAKKSSTGAKSKFTDHYLSILSILRNLDKMLYPDDPSKATDSDEGKILIRILFASCADNIETYLSELLYEIYLACPSSLKSDQQVSIKEVLACSDIQDFIIYWSKKKISKLQRGSVKGFIQENEQIKSLNAINDVDINEIEKILQIRHLYTHNNGISDEKFLKFYPGKLNEEHRLSVDEMLDKLIYIIEFINKIDKSAITKYKLATLD